MCALVQYVNPACAIALNYSAPGELVGRHVDEALTSDKNPIDVYGKIQQQLQTGQVYSRIRTALSATLRYTVQTSVRPIRILLCPRP